MFILRNIELVSRLSFMGLRKQIDVIWMKKKYKIWNERHGRYPIDVNNVKSDKCTKIRKINII